MRADPQPRLSEIIVYPVKSIGGLTLQRLG